VGFLEPKRTTEGAKGVFRLCQWGMSRSNDGSFQLASLDMPLKLKVGFFSPFVFHTSRSCKSIKSGAHPKTNSEIIAAGEILFGQTATYKTESNMQGPAM